MKVPTDKKWIYEQYVTLGKTIIQISRDFNCNRQVIRRRLKKHNIPREGIKGDRNPNWAGNDVGLKALHQYVAKRKPKPEFCERCKKKPPVDLSNNGVYDRNPDNYEWLCKRCHLTKDGAFEMLSEIGFKRLYK